MQTGCVEEGAAVESGEDAELPTEIERTVLHEVFTGSNCGPCLEADEIILEVLHDNPGRYVLLSHQIGSDPYISSEGVARRMYYLPGEGSYSIPYVHADGINGFHPVELNDDAGYTQADFDQFAGMPAALQVEVSHTVTDQTVDIEVSLLPLADNDSETLTLQLAIIEKETFLNVGSNGQTEFHNVMKKMVPDENGTSVGPLVRGETIELSESWTFQGEYDDEAGYSSPVDHDSAHTVEEFEDLAVVAFVQDDDTWEVLHSAWSGE
ncbi:MAG: hypothetical protein QGG40_11505 [Myxococcota bacterium]|nr:hypothetical protein [Myxococcota bacterium]